MLHIVFKIVFKLVHRYTVVLKKRTTTKKNKKQKTEDSKKVPCEFRQKYSPLYS